MEQLVKLGGAKAFTRQGLGGRSSVSGHTGISTIIMLVILILVPLCKTRPNLLQRRCLAVLVSWAATWSITWVERAHRWSFLTEALKMKSATSS